MGLSLGWDEVRARRLARMHLAAPAPREELLEVVRDLGGVQAQVLPAAQHALGLRVAGLTQAAAAAELWERRSLVKTWFLRGTLHLVPAADAARWAAALRALPAEQPWSERHGLDAAQGRALLAAIADALDGRALTRHELADEVTAGVGGHLRELLLSPWGPLLGAACVEGVACFGPSQGARVRFVRLDQWTGRPAEQDDGPSELRALVRRFAATYGPVTHQAVARWFGLRPPAGRALLDLLADELEPVTVERRRAFVLAGERDGDWPAPSPSVRLLAQYDPYVLGGHPRESVVPEAARPLIAATGRGRFEGATGVPVVLADGLVAGVWQRRPSAGGVEIRADLVERPPAARRRALARAANAVGEHLGVTATLALRPLSPSTPA